jgi:hypothetical protein
MSRYGAWVLVGLATFVLAACGASSSAKPLPLRARLIRPGEFKGFTPGTPEKFGTLAEYLDNSGVPDSERSSWVTRLKSEGFEQDFGEFLSNGSGADTGVSNVMQLGSAGSAQAELTAQTHLFEANGASTFPIKTVPGAVGIGTSDAASRGGENIMFADGPFLYNLGYGWNGTTQRPTRGVLIAAATKLYQRVHGRPAS